MIFRPHAILAVAILSLVASSSTSVIHAAPLPSPANLDAIVTQATVRLRIRSGQMVEYGSGTVVDRVGNTALIVTCAHIFEDPKAAIQVTFFNGQKRILPGTLLAQHEKWDVALVRVENVGQVTPIPLARRDQKARIGQPVFVAGCDDGGTPDCWDTRVTAVNRFYGRPNLEVAEIPKDGRSGGGLVSEDLQLLGVCNGVNTLEHQGLYAGADSVHQLATTIDWQQSAPVTSLAAHTPPRLQPAPAVVTTSGQQAAVPVIEPSGYEVICIVRKKGETKKTAEVIELGDAPAALVDAIRAAADSKP